MYNSPEERKASAPRGQARIEETSALHNEDKGLRNNSQRESFTKKGNATSREKETTNGRTPALIDAEDADQMVPALISPIESHEPLLGYPNYPNGIGPSPMRSDSMSQGNPSMSGRLV